MIQPLKLLFDENFGRPLVRAVAGVLTFYRDKRVNFESQLAAAPPDVVRPPVVQSILDAFPSGVLDEEWVPKVASDGWILITTDRAKRCGGRKLPALCVEFGITHVLVSSSLHEAGQFEKARALLAVWEDIVASQDALPGSRFSLRYNQQRRATLVKL